MNNVSGLAPELKTGAFADFGDQWCRNLPPPELGKPSTGCKDAYCIIDQQNYKALDSSVIYEWLESGFRRPISEGDGCRVDTALLFTLLDWINSPWST